MQTKIFKTSVVSLADLQDYKFIIPTYQRPYVWGEEQIDKLIGDFYKTFKINKNELYYIGTILTKEDNEIAELVDGQQRFTTLWLTAFVFSQNGTKSDLVNFPKINESNLRFSFEIRTEVENYFKSLINPNDLTLQDFKSSETIKEYPYLKNIATALVTINGLIKTLDENSLEEFGNFIYNNVKLIKNTTPEKINLNKLFSTINSAGVQLEQTDIIKANLLSIIDEKVVYSKIWETCENMNNFFERNVRESFNQTNFKSLDLASFIVFDKELFKFENTETDLKDFANSTFSIDNISNERISEYNEESKKQINENRESDEIYCRSIINFGQLLLHTYRLHLKKEGLNDFEGTFHINRLIEIFNSLVTRNNSEEIKRFFKLLWKVRFLFDKYIIKWISNLDTKTEHLELVNINRNQDGYYARTKFEKSNILMLQSVMYFTGDYLRQFWLTTYLGYLLDNHNNLKANDELLLDKLEDIDNKLSLCTDLTDKEATYKLLDSDINTTFNLEEYLNTFVGTKFKHYWFQKLEYILFKNWKFDKSKEFESYRITSRNSIEHIYPQNPENKEKSPDIPSEYLHSFGNLVLLSVTQNSEYSRKSFLEKKGLFNYKNTYDTLKSYYIFQKGVWNLTEIDEMRKIMVDKIKQHYSKTL